eukprot:COSAG02_NODE_12509_length_1535_cov_0.991643_1_plen_29_part_10
MARPVEGLGVAACETHEQGLAHSRKGANL